MTFLPPEQPRSLEQSRWFADEVHPHESSLRSYLRSSFPAVHDVDDVVQESYLRLWKARAARPIQSARGFLFQVARHLALDLVRRGRASPINAVKDLSTLPVVAEEPGVADAVSTQEKVRVLGEAISTLPSRCREIVILRKLEGLSQREVATRLDISEKTVEVQVARGVRRCEEFLRRRGISSLYGHGA